MVMNMGDMFRVILQMSITASAVILAVMVLRLLLARAPRKYSYMLWLIVLVRLVCPLCVRTDLSIIPDLSGIFAVGQERQTGEGYGGPEGMSADAISDRTGENGASQKNGAGAVYTIEEQGGAIAPAEELQNREQPDLAQGAEHSETKPADKRRGAALPDSMRISAALWNAAGWCWFAGAAISAICAAAGYMILMRRLKKYEVQTLREIAVRHEGRQRAKAAIRFRVRERARLIEAEEIGSPFTVGMIRPTICLPAGLPEMQREMVIAHEHTHIRRKDHLIKMFAAAVCCIHWFNPLVWIAFRLFERDMESSCDEAAVESLGYERRKDYAKTLLSLSGRRSGVPGLYPVSFGEKNTKARIRNVLELRKTKHWVAVICMIAVAAAAAVLLTSRRPVQASGNEEMSTRESGGYVLGDGGSGADDGTSDTGGGSIEDAAQAVESKTAEENDTEWPAVSEKIMTRVSEMIRNGTLAEGDTRIEKSARYGLYELIQIEDGQQASADGSGKSSGEVLTEGGGMLCNPLIGTDEEMLEGKDIIFLYAYPLAAEDGKLPLITATYGSREHPIEGSVMFHSGCDFSAKKGTPVYAAADGVVYRAGYMGQSGNCVILIHANGDVTYYAHCETILDFVTPGTIVSCGQQIATVGSTGASTGPHLHFSVSRDGAYIEPRFASENVYANQ